MNCEFFLHLQLIDSTCVYTIIRYGVDLHNNWICNWPDLPKMQLLNHAIKNRPTVSLDQELAQGWLKLRVHTLKSLTTKVILLQLTLSESSPLSATYPMIGIPCRLETVLNEIVSSSVVEPMIVRTVSLWVVSCNNYSKINVRISYPCIHG